MRQWSGSPSQDVMLGRVLERTEATHGAVVELREEVRDLTGRVARIEHGPKPETFADKVGAIEKFVKNWATWLLPFAALWATGNLDAAAKLVGLAK